VIALRVTDTSRELSHFRFKITWTLIFWFDRESRGLIVVFVSMIDKYVMNFGELIGIVVIGFFFWAVLSQNI
jgi:hypothetical protein